MGVCKVLEVREEEGEMWGGISEGCAEEDSFAVFPAGRGTLHVGKVIVSDCFDVEVIGRGGKAYGAEEGRSYRGKHEEEYAEEETGSST